MKTTFKVLVTSVLFTFIIQAYLPAAGVQEKTTGVFAALDRRDSPGAAVLVMRDGQIVFERGFGMANLEYDVPITPATIFHVASNSKQFTAFAIMLLVDEGKLSLDDDIRKYLPHVPDFGVKITIRQLLLHTSGLRDQWDLFVLSGRNMADVITQADLLRLVYRQKELNFTPGTKFMYCNTGYMLLSEIVATVSGQPFTDFTRKRIFEPLGMTNTHFHDDCAMIVKNMAYSYAPSARSPGFSKSILSYSNVGATSLFTTVEDLAKWIDNFDTRRVGSESIFKQMQASGTLADGTPTGYGFGLGLWKYRGLDVVSHGGADAGYRSAIYRFPSQRFAVVVLGNLASINPDQYALRLADLYLGVTAGTPPAVTSAKTHTEISVDPAVYRDYAGRYQMAPGFIITLTVENNHLLAQATGQAQFEIYPEGRDAFFAKVADVQGIFVRDAKGTVTALRVLQGGGETKALKLIDTVLTQEQMNEYCGNYYSEELDVTYSLFLKDGRFTFFQLRLGEIPMEQMADDRLFSRLFIISFVRDKDNRITGALASTDRVTNLKFVKVK